jgi:hypothetical protein
MANSPFDIFTVKEKVGIGTDNPTERLEVKGNIKLNTGVAIGEFSNDGTFVAASDRSAPTTLAVKTYTNTQLLTVSQVLANKAELNGTLAQNFQVNNLNAQGNLQVTGNVTATKFIGDGSSLTGLAGVTQWANGAAGSISYSGGKVGIGSSNPEFALDVGERIRVRQGATPSAGIWFHQTTPATDRAFVGMASDTQVGFFGNTGANWGLVMDTTSGDVDITKNLNVKGNLSIPNSGGGSALLTGQKYANEASLKNNNVKLILGNGGFFFPFPGQDRSQYEFAIGETFFRLVFSDGGLGGSSTTFNKRFSIDQSGNLYCAGSKAGFVADYFVNRVGDTLEQGDVVVIAPQPVAYYSGTDNNIPILEVDLTEKAYDTRVCGIVARFVTEQDLPHVEPEPMELPPGMTIEMLQAEAAKAQANPNPSPHALQQFAASPQADAHKVLDRQMGMMVTLGSFAHCKVDADIASIEVGDLLTTSTTKGHAQKVLDSSKALGTIVGKALAPLAQGKGKIPILVMLQ